MGRPRSARTDLPDGLYCHARDGSFYIRTRTVRKHLGRVTRAAAIEAWVALVKRPQAAPDAPDGSFDALAGAWLDHGLPMVGAPRTRAEYARQLPRLRARWGAYMVARTDADAARPGHLTAGVLTAYLDDFRLPGNRPAPSGVQANRDARLVSSIFSWARSRGRVFYHPGIGVAFIGERRRSVTIADADLAAILGHARPVLRVMARLDRLIGARAGDMRLLRRAAVGAATVSIVSGKTGVAQEFERTPALDAVLEDAARLPGTVRSLEWLFATRSGKPYTAAALSRAWSDARAAAIAADPASAARLGALRFSDIRKTAINAVHASGANATDFAGHLDERTTRKHYLVVPLAVKPAEK